jgi:hypothetical protein
LRVLLNINKKSFDKNNIKIRLIYNGSIDNKIKNIAFIKIDIN